LLLGVPAADRVISPGGGSLYGGALRRMVLTARADSNVGRCVHVRILTRTASENESNTAGVSRYMARLMLLPKANKHSYVFAVGTGN
jgi:hypothetical protein